MMSKLSLLLITFFSQATAASNQYMGGQVQKSDMGMMLAHVQENLMKPTQELGAQGCGPNNRIIDGVYMQQQDQVSKSLAEFSKRQQCALASSVAQKQFSQNLNKLVHQAAAEAKSTAAATVNKNQCVRKLDLTSHECFANSVLKGFYEEPVWKVAIHHNAAVLLYKGNAVMMLIYEAIQYNVVPDEHKCFTFFPVSNVVAEENALGHVVKIVGKPEVPKSASKNDCRPCTDFLRNKTVEGAGRKCVNACDPTYLLISNSNFKTKSQSESRKETKSVSSKTEDE